jgi:uncharacterized cupredoxin-like copper-binding protein
MRSRKEAEVRKVMTPIVLALAVVAVAVLAVAPVASSRTAESAATTVRVTASEMKFKLSRKSAKRGTVVFVVRNGGNAVHDFKIKGKKTRLLQPGRTARLRVAFPKAGKFHYVCTVFGHEAAGMHGTFTVR